MSNIYTTHKLLPKEPTEIIPLKWEFDDPAIVVTAVSSTVAVVEGADPSASAILGAATFSGNTFTQVVQGGSHGVVYKIKTSATLGDGSRFVYTVLLPVINL